MVNYNCLIHCKKQNSTYILIIKISLTITFWETVDIIIFSLKKTMRKKIKFKIKILNKVKDVRLD